MGGRRGGRRGPGGGGQLNDAADADLPGGIDPHHGTGCGLRIRLLLHPDHQAETAQFAAHGAGRPAQQRRAHPDRPDRDRRPGRVAGRR